MKTETIPQTVRPYSGETYEAIRPQADTEELCEASARVILYHAGIGKFKTAKLRIAPRGVFASGFVIGINAE